MLQAEYMCDDIELTDRMLQWSEGQARAFFDSGGDESHIWPPLPPLPKPRAPMSLTAFNEVEYKQLAGDTYGLIIPHTIELLRDAGSEWLTSAFRAAGSISESNAVVAIDELVPFIGGGAATKALLTVRWKKPSADLHSRLFVKVPHAAKEKRRDKYIVACIYDMDRPEITFAQKFAARVPVSVPKTYFADRSAASTNFILISERIQFAQTADPLAPNQVQRAYDKFMDHLIPNVLEYYLVLTSTLGLLCGWYKADHERAAELHESLPLPYAGPLHDGGDVNSALMDRQWDLLIEFLGTVAVGIVPADVRDPSYLKQLKGELVHAATQYSRIRRYLYSDGRYIAFAHPNLNIDNAYWWRNAADELQCGLVDWAGYGGNDVATLLDGCLYSAEAEIHTEHTSSLLAAFASACEKAGGPTLDCTELRKRLDLSLALSLAGQAGAIPTIYRLLPREEWKSVHERHNPRLEGEGSMLVRSYAVNVVTRVVRWKRTGAYATLCDFASTPDATPALKLGFC